MRTLIIGAHGFVGRHVAEAMSPDHDVYKAVSGQGDSDDHSRYIDLTKPESITSALTELRPEVVISCAGIVDPTKDVTLNVLFTHNLLEAIIAAGITPQRIIISGSASEYGTVGDPNVAVSEEAPLNADKGYGLSKREETTLARAFARQHGMSLVVARIFNPIGVGMHPRMLVPGVVRQVAGVEAGSRKAIEISRLGSKRDYLSVFDMAQAFKALAECGTPEHDVYNIGSGQATSNQAIAELILKYSGLVKRPGIIETAAGPELPYAQKADISRLCNELGWSPQVSLEDTIKEVVYAEGK